MKDNTYSLLRHLWNDVSEDWPHYSEQERQSFRRRKPQNLTPPCSDGSTSSSGRSPASTHPASPPHVTSASSAASKMPYGMLDGEPASKKRRVSNYVRPPDMRVGDYLNGGGGHSPNGVHSPRTSPLRHQQQHRIGRSPLRSPPGRNSPNNRAVMEQRSSPYRPRSSSSRHRGGGGGENGAAAAVIETPALSAAVMHSPDRRRRMDDFSREFPPVASRQQRLRYKEEFNRNYANYRKLHSRLDGVSKRFAHLEALLKQETVGTEAYRVSTKAAHFYSLDETFFILVGRDDDCRFNFHFRNSRKG